LLITYIDFLTLFTWLNANFSVLSMEKVCTS